MNRVLAKWQALSVVFSIIAVFIILTVFPIRLWREPIEEVSNRIEEGNVQLTRYDPIVRQMFVAQYDHLDGIDIWVTKRSSWKADFAMRVYDENMVLLREEVHRMGELKSKIGRFYVPLNLDTKVGKQYYYTLEGLHGTMLVAYEVTETSGYIYNGPCHVGEEALGGCNLITGYRYGQPLRKVKSALIILGILLVLGGLVCVMKQLAKKNGKLGEIVTLQWAVKVVCNTLIIAGGIVALVAVGPLYMFSYQYADIVIFSMGILILCGILLYAVNKRYNGAAPILNWEYFADNVPHLLQSVCIAMALLACVHYMNGLYDVFHDIAYRQMLIWLGLALVVIIPMKELFSWWNAVGVLAASVWGVWYYRMQLPEMVNEYYVEALKLTCYLAIPCVLSVLHVVYSIIKRKITHCNPVYAVPTVCMAIGIIVMRNGRWWPVMMVVAFGLFGLSYAAWEKKDRYLLNVANGILLNFAGCTIYCLLHRPFMSFGYTRYPHIFHTVTITATYLAVVLAAALVKLCYKYNLEKNWKGCFFESVIFGICACYVLFTMSRTGMLGVIATGLVVWFVSMSGSGKEKFRKRMNMVGVVIASVMVLFPVSFTMQRIVPTVVNQPDQYDEIEQFADEVLVGEDWRSDEYITLDRFLEVFADKLLGLPQETIDLYQYRIQVPDEDDGKGAKNKRPIPMPFYQGEGEIDYTNGRIDIYKSYIAQLTMEGHEEMGAVLDDGSLAVHAHNIYLQFAFDHGIIMGILFVLWIIATGIMTLVYFYRKKDENPAAALPLALTALLASAGIVEWIAHPCNPAGFAFLLVLMPLVFDDIKKKVK